MSIFDIRSLFPRARRRLSQREVAKGVVCDIVGKPRTEAEQNKRAQRRVHRRAMTKAVYDGLMENPAGSKQLRRYAKVSGFVVQESDGKRDWLRKPTAVECEAWYRNRKERRVLVGARLKTEEQFKLFLEDMAEFTVVPYKGEEVRVLG